MDTKHVILPTEEELRASTDVLSVLTWVSDMNKQAYLFSDSWLKFTGRSYEQEKGTGWHKGVHPDDLQNVTSQFHSLFDRQHDFKLKCRVMRRNGEYRWLAQHFVPASSRDGKFAGYIVTSLDIHDLLSPGEHSYTSSVEEALHREQELSEEIASTHEEISATNEELAATNEALQLSQNELAQLNSELESLVLERTTSLLENQHRTKSMIETAPFPIGVYVGREMRIEFANKAITDVWGKGTDVIGKLYSEILPELHNQSVFTQLDDVYTTGIPFNAKNQRIDLAIDGDKLTPFYFTYNFTALRDQQGEIYGVMNTAADVTELMESRRLLEKSLHEQQQVAEELATSNEELAAVNEELTTINEDLTEAQERLFRSEKLFKSIALNIPDSLVIVVDMDQRFLAVEGDLMEKMGYDSKDYIGKHPREASSPERYEASRELYERVLAGERFSVERKGATGEDYMVHLVPLRNELDEVYAGMLIALDITRIKSAELENARLAAIVHSSNDAIVSKTLDGTISSWNKSAERIFGYQEDEMIGQSIFRVIPEDRLDEEPTIIARIKKGERVEHFETQRQRKDGSLIDVSLSISPVTDSEGNVVGVSKIARDISEKKLEENRKNDFIGMVSHELKTPLTSLTALIQVVSLKLKSTNDLFLTGATEKAAIQAKKMATMINGFLNVSRLESGKLLIEKRQFEIRGVINEVIAEAQLVYPGSNIEFISGKELNVFADADKIGSVISNLIGNAVKYSERGSAITIACVQTDAGCQVSVRDEGIGINEQDIDRLFERYYRVETSDTRHISGFGIGLYLSSEIVKRHGGNIWAESEAGKGSTFYFSIPSSVS